MKNIIKSNASTNMVENTTSDRATPSFGPFLLPLKTLQKWTKNISVINRIVSQTQKNGEPFEMIYNHFSMAGSKSRPTFETMRQMLYKKDLQFAASALISCLPNDTALSMHPQVARGPRSILSAAMITAYPDEILFDEIQALYCNNLNRDKKVKFEAKLLKCAAALLVSSLKDLCFILSNIEKESIAVNRNISKALNCVTFSRRFFAHAFVMWKRKDEWDIAEASINAYAEAYRIKLVNLESSNSDLLLKIDAQLEQYHSALSSLIGHESSNREIQALEKAVQAELLHPKMSEILEEMPSDHLKEDQEKYDNSNQQEKKFENINDVLGENEALAHQIMIDPKFFQSQSGDKLDYSIIPSIASNAAVSIGKENDQSFIEGTLEQRVAHTMHRVFWERLVQSLAPALLEVDSPTDVKVGMRVQARFGDAFYAAVIRRVEWIDSDGDPACAGDDDAQPRFDLFYDQDQYIEKAVPFSRLRKKTDPLDSAPLVSILNELCSELNSLTPNRKDLNEELKSVLDPEFIGQMATHGALDTVTLTRIIRYTGNRILMLQAPSRNEATKMWLRNFEADMDTVNQKEGRLGPIRLLPRIFEFFFAKINEVRIDTVNSHIAQLVPYLKVHGVSYEQKKFQNRLSSGEVNVVRTIGWLASTVTSLSQADLQALSKGHHDIVNSILHRCFLELLEKADLSDNAIPETLAMDVTRIMTIRKTTSDIILVASMLLILQQAFSSWQITCTMQTLVDTQEQMFLLMHAGRYHDVQLINHVLKVARDEGIKSARTISTLDEQMLVGQLQQCLRQPSHPVKDVIRGRVHAVLQGCLEEKDSSQLEKQLGVAAHSERLHEIKMHFNILVHHNIKVHGDRYRDILTSVVKELNSGKM